MTKNDNSKAVELLCNAVETESVGNEREIADFISGYIKENAGIEASVWDFAPGRSNVMAKISGKSNENAVLLNGHLDTVPFGSLDSWNTPPNKATIVGDTLYGRGAADMKSGLCAMLFAFCQLAKSGAVPQNDIYFIGTGDEETDGLGARSVAEKGLLDNVCSIVIAEPTANKISVASKGALWLEISITGKTSHGAYPEQGVNAAEISFVLTSELKKVVEGHGHPYLGNSTCTLTCITAGVKANVIPDNCKVVYDIRTVPSMCHDRLLLQIEEITNSVKALYPGCDFDINILTNRASVGIDQQHPLVLSFGDSVKSVTEQEPQLAGTSFFSDATIFARSHNIPTILFGPGSSDEAHKPNESVDINDYLLSIDVYSEFLNSLI